MINSGTSIEMLFEKAENYSKTSAELYKMNVIDRSADAISSLAIFMILSIVISFVGIIVNIGIALWLGELLGKSCYGFFLLTGFYSLLSILLYVYRDKWIKFPVSNVYISRMLNQTGGLISGSDSMDLNTAIVSLRTKQAEELKLVKDQFCDTCESLKPINLIKSTLYEVTSGTDIKTNLLNNAIGLTTGFLSKKVLVGSSHNPVKKLFGNLLEFAIANVVVKYFNKEKSTEI